MGQDKDIIIEVPQCEKQGWKLTMLVIFEVYGI